MINVINAIKKIRLTFIEVKKSLILIIGREIWLVGSN